MRFAWQPKASMQTINKLLHSGRKKGSYKQTQQQHTAQTTAFPSWSNDKHRVE